MAVYLSKPFKFTAFPSRKGPPPLPHLILKDFEGFWRIFNCLEGFSRTLADSESFITSMAIYLSKPFQLNSLNFRAGRVPPLQHLTLKDFRRFETNLKHFNLTEVSKAFQGFCFPLRGISIWREIQRILRAVEGFWRICKGLWSILKGFWSIFKGSWNIFKGFWYILQDFEGSSKEFEEILKHFQGFLKDFGGFPGFSIKNSPRRIQKRKILLGEFS